MPAPVRLTVMKHLFLLGFCLPLFGLAQDRESNPLLRPMTRFPKGDVLLRQVQEGLPRDHMRFAVRMSGKDAEGEKVAFDARIDVDWSARPPRGVYEILDEDGAVGDRLSVTWLPNQAPVTEFQRGGERVEGFRITDKVKGLDLTWADLTLSFIWWRGGKTIEGGLKKLGRPCYVVEVEAPEWEKHLFSKAHVYIDDQARMVLQAKTFGADGKPRRYFDVDAIEEYAPDEWMAKRLEFATLDHRGKRRNKIRVDFDIDSLEKLP